METTYYIAVRSNIESRREWYDTSAMSLILEQSQRWAQENDQKIPSFYKTHPVVRFATVKLIEI